MLSLFWNTVPHRVTEVSLLGPISLPSPGSNFPVAQTLVGYYSGIPSVSHPPSSKLARKSEQFFGNRRLYLHHRNGKEEGGGSEEGSGGVLFANFHDLSRGW